MHILQSKLFPRLFLLTQFRFFFKEGAKEGVREGEKEGRGERGKGGKGQGGKRTRGEKNRDLGSELDFIK